MRRTAILLGGLQILLTAAPVWALITTPTPLSAELSESQFICTMRVETVDSTKPGVVLAVDEALKGKPPFRKLAVNLTGDADSVKKKETPLLLKRLAPKMSLILFVNQNDKHFTAFAYSNGTWFQMAGERTDDGDVLRLPFTHIETYLRRTFKGTTAEMKQVVEDGLSGKKAPPEPDLKVKPGVGPEVETPDAPKENEKTQGTEAGASFGITSGPVFGVIPMLVVGPLALLAMLFPAVFGGLTLVLRRWTTALTVLSINSTLLFLQNIFDAYLISSWLGTATALWLVMSLVTLAGTLWAWRKHAARLAASVPIPAPEPVSAQSATDSSQFTWSRPMAHTVNFFPLPAPFRFAPPHRGELITLGAMSLACLGMAYFLPHTLNNFGPLDKTVVMFIVGIWAATLHACFLRWVVARRRDARPGLPGEGVLLAAMLAVCIAFAFTLAPGAGAADSRASQASSGDDAKTVKDAGGFVVRREGVRELFKPKAPSWIASSPSVDGDRIYVGVVHGAAFRSGALYCLDRATGEPLWAFSDGGAMKDVFSSPCVADGKVYIGEGFHQHSGCKLFCLDAVSGKKLWQVQTGSHTESSPCVAGGKVYFGAGDDGLYCVDAADGEVVWHEGKGLHVDASPLVVGGRVYCGSGVGDAYQETCVFCLDAATGKERWRQPTDLPVWGEAALAGDRLYVGAGNGNFMTSEGDGALADSKAKPAGAVLCFKADAGDRVWRYDVADGVHVRVVADRSCVYFASRDQNCYCLDRADGRLLWKKDLGSPVVASPAVVRCSECGCAVNLYVAAADGQVYCLDPATGAQEWLLDVAKEQKLPAELFSSPTAVVSRDAGGDRRRVYFGCGLNTFQRGVLYCVEDVRGRPIAAK
jgi:outer membrane protein assembly factor BamB